MKTVITTIGLCVPSSSGMVFFLILILYSSWFFFISAFFGFICILLYAFVFPHLEIVKYYRAKAAYEGSKTVTADLAAGGLAEVEKVSMIEDFIFSMIHIDIFLAIRVVICSSFDWLRNYL